MGLTSSTGRRALGPRQVVPGEAHLVVATSCALDGHVELVAYSQVLFLQEDLQQVRKEEGAMFREEACFRAES